MAQDNKDMFNQSFGEMVTQWERNFDAFANQVMGTEAYSQAMNEMQKAQLGAQQMFNQNMTQQLAALNLPSREDVLVLTEMVQGISRRLEIVEQRLVQNDKPAADKQRPKRTKKPKSDDSAN